ncbi:MAG: ATP-dependent helicase HrpB [Gammaproteobacteria bacterium]|nr:ATP-dependent helicase HrpB [Gammaproteobacteria bacterium]MCP5135630.1 ATP-dependent helicase HrpB [Gammaproteobacteria bacterium]
MTVSLPIDVHLDAIRAALSDSMIVLLSAPPGSGKTTRIPPALLSAEWLSGQGIVMLEPRRLATRAAARRMAEERGENVGDTIGYRVRFDNTVSARTRIEVVTEAILTRRLQNDPELNGVGLVIFDEFHERNLHSDLGLALCRDVQNGLRPGLRILIMSATLDVEGLRRALGEVRLIEAPGQAHPVEMHYLPRDSDARIEDVAAAGIQRALRETEGDVLVFLPGGGEIQRVSERLPQDAQTVILPLFGDLAPEAQDLALSPDPHGRRKVVLATPIAETSLTIPGVRVVVDAGFARVAGFDAVSGLGKLTSVRISRASAEQRAGRAGRQGPGVCFRLWSESTQQGLLAHLPPEIAVSDLAPLTLELALWGVDDPGSLAWIDAPPIGHYAQAIHLLQELGALDRDRRITALGRKLAGQGAHPRIAAMLAEADRLGLRPLAADLAALLSERDVFRAGPGGPGRHVGVDVEDRLSALAAFRSGGRQAARQLDADPAACGQVARVAKQFGADGTPDGTQAGRLLMYAFPDRIAQRRDLPGDGSPARYRLANGKGAWLAASDPLAQSSWLLAARLDAGQGEAKIQSAARLALTDIERDFAERIVTVEAASWDERSNGVIARRERRLDALVLSSEPWLDPPAAMQQLGLLDAIRRKGLTVLPWNDNAQALRGRVAFVSRTFPETDWPDWPDWPDWSDKALLDSLETWLLPYLNDMRRLDHLKALNLTDILHAALGWQRQRALDDLAPTHLVVPSGSRVRIDYASGEIPILAVRLQEMFGATATPALAAGKVPVLLHLLSPGRRPIQVTRDLAGFWDRTYAEVKKELKGRYPKHYWPDDPLQAEPTARAKPRGT